MTDGPDKAKKNCIDHSNSKRQTALMVACKHGHPDCVEYLVTNGADPLLTDERRHNTCLHFAALYGHSECVHKLLGSRAAYRVQGRQVSVAQIPCPEEEGAGMKFIDRHNGWGLSALHIAVFQGSVSTVRALLRHGADLESVIVPSKVENSPIRCAIGSNVLHIAALTGNVVMAKMILEAQEGYSGLELRSRTNSTGLRPQDYAQRARNPVLVHLLDERLPVTLLRQIWMNYSLEQSLPPRHQTLGSLLQKLKLMFNLELIAIQRNMGLIQLELTQQQPPVTKSRMVEVAGSKLLWTRRQEDITQLQSTVTRLHANLSELCKREDAGQPGDSAWANRAATYEAVLDFILSTLITPRTVSAILHAAKKLVTASTSSPTADAPLGDSDSQHGLALLTTALRAVETCLQAATFLTQPIAEQQERAAAAAQHQQPALQPAPSTGSSPHAEVSFSANGVPLNVAVAPASAGGASNSLGAASVPPGTNPAAPGTAAAVASVAARSTPPVTASSSLAASGFYGTASIGAGHQLLLHRGLDLGGAAAFPSSHWSAHLHTLIAQLQWDIGVQRHRRRRAHAAAAAARSAAAAAAVVAATGASSPTAAAAASAAGQASRLQAADQARGPAHGHRVPAATTATAAGTQSARQAEGAASALQLLRALSSRRGDALQEVVAAPAPLGGTTAPDAVTPRQTSSPDEEQSGGRGHVANAGQEVQEGAISVADIGIELPAVSDGNANMAAAPGADAQGYAAAEAAQGVRQPHLASLEISSLPLEPLDEADGAMVAAAAATGANPALARVSRSSMSASSLVTAAGAMHIARMAASARAREAAALAAQQATASAATAASSGASKPGRGASKASASQAPANAEADGAVREKSLRDLDGPDDSAPPSESASDWSEDDHNVCSICMDLPVAVLVQGCQHGLCVQCAFQLCAKGRELPCCPFCRQKIGGFEPKPAAPTAAVGEQAGAASAAAAGAAAPAGGQTANTASEQLAAQADAVAASALGGLPPFAMPVSGRA